MGRIHPRAAVARRAEQAVADHLAGEGWTLLGRNVRLGPLELDIVAQRDDLVAIVEVRTRGAGSYVNAFASITPAKRKTLLRAAERWSQLHKGGDWSRLRIDVAAVRFEADGHAIVDYAPGAITG